MAYDSIDTLPVGIWFKINKSIDNLKLLTIEGNPTKIELYEEWHKIQKEFVKEIGISKEFSQYIDKLQKYMELQNQYALTQDRKLLNRIEMLEMDVESIKQKLGGNEDVDDFKTIANMSLVLNKDLDPMTTTVRMYFTYHDIAKERSLNNG